MNVMTDNRRKTLEEWIKIYELKTKDTYRPKENYNLFFLPSRGFCEVLILKEKGYMFVDHLCGDIHFWVDLLDLIGQAEEVKEIVAYFHRYNGNPRAYIRLLGYKIIEELKLYDDDKRLIKGFLIEDKQGRRGRFIPCYAEHKENRQLVYMISFEIGNKKRW